MEDISKLIEKRDEQIKDFKNKKSNLNSLLDQKNKVINMKLKLNIKANIQVDKTNNNNNNKKFLKNNYSGFKFRNQFKFIKN